VRIDWFTLIAQIVNFLILLWLLKHFLFDKIVRAMRERKEKVAAQFDEAEQKKREAEETEKKYRAELDKIDDKRDQAMAEAREEADRIKKEAREKARREAEKMRSDWLESLEAEKDDFKRELRVMSGREVLAMARDVLRHLAGTELQDRVIEAFARRVHDLNDEDAEDLRGKIDSDKPTVRIRSSFELSDDQVSDVEEALIGVLDRDKIELELKTDENLILGLEIDIDGHRLGWSAAGLIDEVEERFEHEIERAAKSARESDEKAPGEAEEMKSGKGK
jgi:F-type H+-transporting ATPase subunit b